MIYSTLKKYKFGYEIIQSESQSNMYSLSHASTSSSPHLQLPRTTVLRRTSSSLSFQASELDEDSADFGEIYIEGHKFQSSYECGDQSDHDHHDHHHSRKSEKEKQVHNHSHENYRGNESHDQGHSHSSKVKHLPTLSYIFSSLPPSQKTLFTWGTIHLFLGILLWLKGQWGCGLGKFFYIYIFFFNSINTKYD